MRTAWWKEGVKFQCQGSGNCCVSRGGYGYVYLTSADRKRLAAFLKLSVREFTRQYCNKTDGYFHLKEEPQHTACRFLKEKRCTIYKARPTQCRTWPFWPENMSPKAWSREVAAFCPGVGKGAVVPSEKIQTYLDTKLL